MWCVILWIVDLLRLLCAHCPSSLCSVCQCLITPRTRRWNTRTNIHVVYNNCLFLDRPPNISTWPPRHVNISTLDSSLCRSAHRCSLAVDGAARREDVFFFFLFNGGNAVWYYTEVFSFAFCWRARKNQLGSSFFWTSWRFYEEGRRPPESDHVANRLPCEVAFYCLTDPPTLWFDLTWYDLMKMVEMRMRGCF